MLIGLVLLAIGLLAIAGMQITSVRGNFFSSNLSEASVVAQDCMEALRNVPYGDAKLTSGNHTFAELNITLPPPMTGGGYNVSVFPGTTMLSIVVTVSWRDSTDHTISFTTIRSQ